MAIFKNKKRTTCKMRTALAAAVFVSLVLPFAAGASLSDKVEEMSASLDELEDKVRSTLMSGGSAPVSFSGEARLKMQYHNLGFDAPGYMQADRSYLQSGWEGNENMFRLGMVARPGRNTVLWAKIGLQHTMTGNRYYSPDRSNWDLPGSYPADPNLNPIEVPDPGEGFVPYQYRHDKMHNQISIHEDMSAGIAIRTSPASFWARMGNTMWTEASPLSVWKAQPRTFAWEYLPFEVEQPISRYYEYNIARGIKEGRAAWNKRPFNGIQLESIELPLGLYANFVYGTFERYDNFEREYIDAAGDIAYGDGSPSPFPSKASGIGDSYRNVIHGRVAQDKALGNLMLGLNYVGIRYKDDVLFASKGNREGNSLRVTYNLLDEFGGYDSVFYKQPHVFSVDVRGPINDNFSIMADVAFSIVDTVWKYDTNTTRTYANRMTRPEWYTETGNSWSSLVPAVYTQVNYTGGPVPITADIAYIGKGFYSPFSFVMPADAFFAFGSNMVGAGKFMARGEGTPYVQNMMGINLTFAPKVEGYGHLRFKYGQHFNVTDDGQDLLFFPYRLNGADMFSFFHSSFNRWGNSLIDQSTGISGNKQVRIRRLGDESFVHNSSFNTTMDVKAIAGPGMGGLRSDFMSMYEGFVPYESAAEAHANFSLRNISGDYQATEHVPGLSSIMHHTFTDTTGALGYRTTNTNWVPVSRKFTNNFEIEAAYDISRFVGYDKDLFVGGYFGMSSVTRGEIAPIALPGDSTSNTLLWSAYVRFEPAIALSKTFYILGLFGYETWRSEHSWAIVNRSATTAGELFSVNPTTATVADLAGNDIVRVPIHTSDITFGLGFDWDMLARVGLHGRVKWMSHTDVGLNKFYESRGFNDVDAQYKNDWSTPVISLEIKTWF